MHTVSTAEIKAHHSEILNRVLAGENVIVTRRGEPIVRIESIKKPLKPLPNLEKFPASFPRMNVSSADVLRQLRDELVMLST